jgi:hypothetical protein
MANRVRHTYLNSLEVSEWDSKWHKWLTYGLADAELACFGGVEADLSIGAKRFYGHYSKELASLSELFTERNHSMLWYVIAYDTLRCHLKSLLQQNRNFK